MSQHIKSSRGTIVVVEDNHLNLKLVSALLASGGYDYFSARDAEAGITLIKQHRPDLVLMDIQLPGMDGMTATRMIKADPQLCHIPVVALSAHAMYADQHEAKSNGMAGYITKPFCTRTFIEKIARYMPTTSASKRAVIGRSANRKRILVVDDEVLNLKLIEAKLSNEAYAIKCLTKGKEVLAVARNFLPDLILLDVIMPDMNGFDVVKKLKFDPVTHNTPVVLITQLDSPEDKSKGLAAGADDFLNKPLNTEELKARVRSLLRMKRYKEQLDGREASARSIYSDSNEACKGDIKQEAPTVLIAEDNANDATLLIKYLQKLNCRLIHSKTGEAALGKIRVEKPDLVLLDLILPDHDGWTICRRIKEDDDLRQTQVAIITSLKDLDSRIRSIEAGTDDFVIKPVQAEELCARVTALLKKKAYLDGLVSKKDMAVQSAITDSLTGLFAHGYLKHFLELEIKRAARYQHVLAFVMIDVDDFKLFNDNHGHLAGDAALVDLAQVFKESIRTTDLAARYGGEEFAVVLPYTTSESAVEVVVRMKDAITRINQARKEGVARLPTVSVGISVFPAAGIQSAEDLILVADKALYAAKRDGKNCFRLAPGAVGAATHIRAVH